MRSPLLLTAAFAFLGFLILGVVGLAAWGVWGTPPPYPAALRSNVRLPSISFINQNNCQAVTVVAKSFYTTPQHQTQLITWFKDNGWMKNYKFDDSVLRQSVQSAPGGLAFSNSQEIFIANTATGANFVFTTQNTLSHGNC